jgi:hypothetical protein
MRASGVAVTGVFVEDQATRVKRTQPAPTKRRFKNETGKIRLLWKRWGDGAA